MILIVGGAGYIGSHVNKLLNARNYKTVVFDNLSRGHRNLVKWGTFVQGDIGNRSDITKCFDQYPISAVMHFGAFAYVHESVLQPSKYYLNNVSYTVNLLDSMIEYGIKDFIFSSTCATYGIPTTIPIPEDHPQRPINPYGRSKLIVETILRDFEQRGLMRHAILRYFNAAGADPDGEIGEAHTPETHLIPLTLRAASGAADGITIFGTDYPTPDGTCIRDYVHVMDLAEAHVKALEYIMQTGKSCALNLGAGTGHSIRNVIESVERVTGKRIAVKTAPRREGDPPVLISDSKNAGAVLEWRPSRDLDAIIDSAWRWHQQIPKIV